MSALHPAPNLSVKGTLGRTQQAVPTAINADPLFLELGKALYVFQAIEARIKLLLPHLALPATGEPPIGEGWPGRDKYVESKEMLGNLVRLLHERITTDDPLKVEEVWRAVVQGRNEVVHHFAQQPFARCESLEELHQSIAFVRLRRTRALPLLSMLDQLLHGYVAALALPPEFEGELLLEPPAGPTESAA